MLRLLQLRKRSRAVVIVLIAAAFALATMSAFGLASHGEVLGLHHHHTHDHGHDHDDAPDPDNPRHDIASAHVHLTIYLPAVAALPSFSGRMAHGGIARHEVGHVIARRLDRPPKAEPSVL